MPVFEVIGGGDRRSLIKRFERKSKHDAVSELVDFHLLHCSRIERLEAEIAELRAGQVTQSGQVPAIQVCKLGIHGKAYDLPETKRAYTYAEQPDSQAAWRIGESASSASLATAGDLIDRGLVLLRELQGNGFGVFELDVAPALGGEHD